MSKGSWQRPGDKRKFDENYDKIFRRKDNEIPRDIPDSSDDTDSDNARGVHGDTAGEG